MQILSTLNLKHKNFRIPHHLHVSSYPLVTILRQNALCHEHKPQLYRQYQYSGTYCIIFFVAFNCYYNNVWQQSVVNAGWMSYLSLRYNIPSRMRSFTEFI
jgi:hypothetical protein